MGASANSTGICASNRTAFIIAASNGSLAASCNMPPLTAAGSTEYWNATFVEILLRASVGTVCLCKSTNGQPMAAASFCRNTSSATPRSRAMNVSSGSVEPPVAAARHDLRQSSNWAGVASATVAIRFFAEPKAMRFRRV